MSELREYEYEYEYRAWCTNTIEGIQITEYRVASNGLRGGRVGKEDN